MTTRSELFLDTSFGLALVLGHDIHHDLALQLSRGIEQQRQPVVTTTGVILELGNALARLRYRSLGISLIRDLRADTRIEIVVVDDALIDAGYEIYEQYDDKNWGLADCISFVLMRERGISDALTADRHFQQAGYRALLLDDPV